MVKKCPKCNGVLIVQTGRRAEEWTEDEYYKCNKCGYNPSPEEYKKL